MKNYKIVINQIDWNLCSINADGEEVPCDDADVPVGNLIISAEDWGIDINPENPDFAKDGEEVFDKILVKLNEIYGYEAVSVLFEIKEDPS